jgi:hypothetical protein
MSTLVDGVWLTVAWWGWQQHSPQMPPRCLPFRVRATGVLVVFLLPERSSSSCFLLPRSKESAYYSHARPERETKRTTTMKATLDPCRMDGRRGLRASLSLCASCAVRTYVASLDELLLLLLFVAAVEVPTTNRGSYNPRKTLIRFISSCSSTLLCTWKRNSPTRKCRRNTATRRSLGPHNSSRRCRVNLVALQSAGRRDFDRSIP